jgi:oxaloacetate decarboxylase alpha subunit
VSVGGQEYVVQVADGGDVTNIQPTGAAPTAAAPVAAAPAASGEPVPAPLAGNIFKILVSPGQQVEEGETIFILEAMKMETEVSAPKSGVIGNIQVKEGDSVQVGQTLVTL